MKMKNVEVKRRKYARQAFQARARLINRSARSRLTSSDLRWYCLVVAPQHDMAAQRILRDKGFHSFVPLDYRYRKVSKFSKKKMRVVTPAMPGYMFIGMERGREDWPTVMDINVVAGVIGVRGCPVSVDGAEVLAFLVGGADKWSVPKEHRFMQSNKEYDVGDDVKIAIGPWSGQIVTVREIDRTKAKISLEVFGAAHDIVLPLDALVPSE